MKKKNFAAVLVCLLSFAVASAQEYSIRANRGLNLRAAPSLSADIADRVRSGAILHVFGQSGNWLQINGQNDAAWLAAWVDFSRLDAESELSTQTETETAATINNCCFVDRLCTSDKQWVDGYWAYQNNHCSTSTRSQTQTVSQPARNETGAIDNCCFAGWQCNSDQDWINGYLAYQDNQCTASPSTQADVDSCCALGWNCTIESDRILGRSVYADYGGQCVVPAVQATVDGVIIEGSAWFFGQLKQIIGYLKRSAPEWHAYLVRGPLKIREITWGNISGQGVARSYALGKSINLHPRSIAGNQPARSYILMHEACHVQRTIAGLLRYETHLEQRIEEVICDLVGVYMIDSTRPTGYSSKYVTASADRLISDGVTNINELANAERQRAFHLLATMP